MITHFTLQVEARADKYAAWFLELPDFQVENDTAQDAVTALYNGLHAYMQRTQHVG